MKVLELLEEIEEICETSSSMPLISNKIVVDKAELMEIVKEVRQALPDEIQQAQFIKNERERILEEAKQEYSLLIKDAEKQAEVMVDQHEITERAKERSNDIMTKTKQEVKKLQLNTFEYIDEILRDFQQTMDTIDGRYIQEMFQNIQQTFENIGAKLNSNRSEIKELAYKTQIGDDM
ncbi:MAG: ATPase [Clostridiales Family XIII bacterium]|jgi:vacuolar-type H+-ATPase subunit H|nr:ATPase [Clostridiales Family XIII bacterium]